MATNSIKYASLRSELAGKNYDASAQGSSTCLVSCCHFPCVPHLNYSNMVEMHSTEVLAIECRILNTLRLMTLLKINNPLALVEISI
jgi:hypothetical protein